MKNLLGRATHKISATVGRVDTTVNIQFQQELEKFEHQYKIMKKLIKDVGEFLKALRALGTAHNGLNEGIASFYDMSCDMWQTNLKNQQLGLDLDKYRLGLDEKLDLDLIAPLNAYMGQYKLIRKRCKERESRRSDYDRLRAEVKKLTINPSDDPAKLEKAKRSLRIAKANFEDLEAELLRDLPKLHADRLTFFDPCFATIVHMIGGYYRYGAKLFDELTPMVQHINTQAVHNRPLVITDESLTAAKKKRKDDADIPHDPTQDFGYHPSAGSPQQYYSPPGTQGGYGGGGYGGGPQQGGYGGGPQQGGYGGGPQQGGYGGGPQQGGYGGGPQQPRQSGYGGGSPQGDGRALPPPPRPGGGGAPGGQRAQALYPFQAQSPQELSFQYGDVLTILNKNGDWWEAELNGRRGLIPGNYVQPM